MRFTHILLATDYSAGSDQAAEVAQSLARASGGTVEMVHAYSAMPLILPDGSALPPDPAGLVRAQEQAENEMEGAVTRFRRAAPDVEVRGQAVLGNALDELLALARSGRFDVLVMGTHGRRGLRRLLMGSLAESVLRHSPIPVLAVRMSPPAEASETVAATHG
jgi:nucleotide-binding universal stress UspA family protein